jgi:hypothetical protein
MGRAEVWFIVAALPSEKAEHVVCVEGVVRQYVLTVRRILEPKAIDIDTAHRPQLLHRCLDTLVVHLWIGDAVEKLMRRQWFAASLLLQQPFPRVLVSCHMRRGVQNCRSVADHPLRLLPECVDVHIKPRRAQHMKHGISLAIAITRTRALFCPELHDIAVECVQRRHRTPAVGRRENVHRGGGELHLRCSLFS